MVGCTKLHMRSGESFLKGVAQGPSVSPGKTKQQHVACLGQLQKTQGPQNPDLVHTAWEPALISHPDRAPS